MTISLIGLGQFFILVSWGLLTGPDLSIGKNPTHSLFQLAAADGETRAVSYTGFEAWVNWKSHQSAFTQSTSNPTWRQLMSGSISYPVKTTNREIDVRFEILMSILLTIMLAALPASAVAIENERLVVLPFEIVDNTPAPGGEQRNQKMLDMLTNFIGESINDKGIFDVVSQSQVNEAVDAAQLGTYIRNCNRCEYDLAKSMAGDKVMTGWIYKMSILVLTMHIEVKDVESGKTLIRKAYDFRGDNEQAWLRAAGYMVRDLDQMMAE
ncbi:MAG: DUF3280 domain-containing protein [Candidatus Thiodiazotropha sp.]